jgi:demethylmenaquinone methyltransferase/2-methoxy-6-polyprenyl-1,4-benzoquinol methylase
MAPTAGSPEKAAVRSMFDRIAPRYDLLNRMLSAGIDVRWRRAAADALGAGGERLLDLCTGTGDLLIEALSRDASRHGAGLDLSEQMLVRGLAKLGKRGLSARASLAAGDGEHLPLRAGLFDGALVAFGIRNIGQPECALRELHRVIKPGGRLVILEFSMPRGALGAFYRFYFSRVLPRIGGFVSGDPSAYAYLPASVERFHRPEGLQRLMEEAGFAEVTFRPLTGGIAHLHVGRRPAQAFGRKAA